MGTYTMQYRRKREGKTDYRRRMSLLQSGLPRLVVRASNKSVQAQLVEYLPDGDKVLATARATDLRKLGWTGAVGNMSAAYLTGLLLVSKLKSKPGDVIVDIGLHTHHKGGRLYAVAKGAIDAGLTVRIGDDALPTEERLLGKHISETTAAQVETIKRKLGK